MKKGMITMMVILTSLFVVSGCKLLQTNPETVFTYTTEDGKKIKYRSDKDQQLTYKKKSDGSVTVKINSSASIVEETRTQTKLKQSENLGKLIDMLPNLPIPAVKK